MALIGITFAKMLLCKVGNLNGIVPQYLAKFPRPGKVQCTYFHEDY